MSLRLYKSNDETYNVIKIVEHNHNNIEALNKISDIDNEPYYNDDKILTQKDNIEDTMIQYNFTNIKANKKLTIVPIDKNGNTIDLHDSKVIVQNFKRNNEGETNITTNIMFDTSSNKNEWVYDDRYINYTDSIKYNTEFKYDVFKESSEGLYESEEINKTLFKDIKSIDNYNLSNACEGKTFSRVDVLNDCNVVSIAIEGGGAIWGGTNYINIKDVVFDNDITTYAKVSQLDMSRDRTFVIDLQEVTNVCSISCYYSSWDTSGSYHTPSYIKQSDDNKNYENIEFEATTLSNGEYAMVFKKPVTKKYIKFCYNSTHTYGCYFHEIKLYTGDISDYINCIIKSNDKYIIPTIDEYNPETNSFNEYDTFEEVYDKLVPLYTLTENITVNGETFIPISKLPDKFTILKKTSVPFCMKALSKTYLFYYKGYYALDNLENLLSITLKSGIATNEIVQTSNLKCIFSFDCGLTWKSYDFYNTAFLNIDDIELTNESVSDINLQDKVINYGIDASKLKDIVFDNFVTKSFKILFAFDVSSYTPQKEFHCISIKYNSIGSFIEMINEKEYFTTLKNNEISIIPTIDTDQMKTNIVIRDKGSNIINVSTVDTDELVQLIKNNIELGLIAPKDLSLNYNKEFTYDENGNIIKISVIDADNSTSYYNILEYDDNNYLIKESLYDSADILIGYKNITYDDNGNIINIVASNYNNLLAE